MSSRRHKRGVTKASRFSFLKKKETVFIFYNKRMRLTSTIKKLEAIEGEQKDRGGWAKWETMYGVKPGADVERVTRPCWLHIMSRDAHPLLLPQQHPPPIHHHQSLCKEITTDQTIENMNPQIYYSPMTTSAQNQSANGQGAQRVRGDTRVPTGHPSASTQGSSSSSASLFASRWC